MSTPTAPTPAQKDEMRRAAPRLALIIALVWLASAPTAVLDYDSDPEIVILIWFFSVVIAAAAITQITGPSKAGLSRNDVDKEWYEAAIGMLLGMGGLIAVNVIGDGPDTMLTTLLGLTFITAAVKACLAVHLSHRPED